uniref:Beta-xylanase (EC) n=1 Tax=Ganoderma boninense TaxID=34458 RepID=A0A5K1K0X1_9APHY|nr:Beta-xylanase (EC [Ganoderma boninense]
MAGALSRTRIPTTLFSARHESFVRGRPSPPQSTVVAAAPIRAYHKYPLPDLHEVCPGVLASGQLTDNHPLVNAYIEALGRIVPRHANKPTSSSASTPASAAASLPSPDSAAPPQHAPYRLTHWVAHHAGIAATLTVSNVISQQLQLFPSPAAHLYRSEVPKLTQAQKEAIFVLAALKVMNHPKHPAHFAFWAKNVLERTAQVVDSVLQLRPCPVLSSVGWMGIQENTWALEGLQSLYIPAQVVQQKKAGGMTLRKRKATANNANAQSPAADDEPEKPRKRVRTTRASQRAKAALSAAHAEDADAGEEQAPSSSLLFSSEASAAAAAGVVEALASPAAASALDGAVCVTRDVKQEFIATTPVLQAIGLMLELPKPAPPGPCSLVSTPLSAIDTPLPAADAVLPETPECAAQAIQKRNRSGSRGSSTAVSDAGYPSEEGTVVDAEMETEAEACRGKRKAVEVELADFVDEEREEERDSNPKSAKGKSASGSGSRKAPAAKKRRVSAAGGGGKRRASRKA